MSQGPGWRAELSTTWNVLGPFPIHAREQHFLSPSFPLNLAEPIDFSKAWPSAYADGGKVSWTKLHVQNSTDVKISFPKIRWNELRATEGWAALQHHAVLHTSLTLYPPPEKLSPSDNSPQLLVELKRGSFFTVIACTEKGSLPHESPVPEWHACNIYDMERAVPAVVSLPTPPSRINPTTYHVIVSGDYEIRLFGDPRAYDSEVPVLSISLAVDVESPVHQIVREPTQDIVFDFVDGFAFGDAFGIGLRSISGWWTVQHLKLADGAAEGLKLTLLRSVRIAPTQTLTIPIKFTQSLPFHDNQIRFDLTLVSETTLSVISVVLPVKRVPLWTASDYIPIKSSYFYANSMPTSYLVIPPMHVNLGEPRPPILALHGAGVDTLKHSFWAKSISRQKRSWVVLPTGRTSWGLDWHGPSAKDAWGSLDALVATLERNKLWHPWRLAKNITTVVIGHSNGGQGSWYFGSRYPDRVLAVVAAAGYIKSQSYIPLTMSRSAHFLDPSLRAILESALTPDDNDLFLSNLADTPVLVVHGGSDRNVPTWHSRESTGVLQVWNPNANVILREDDLQPHWYPSVLNNAQVQAFLESILESPHWIRPKSNSFTLTVAMVAESGSLHGWKIESLEVPGRMARLHVVEEDGTFHVTTNNVHSFSIRGNNISQLNINGMLVPVVNDNDGVVRLRVTGPRSWLSIAPEDSQATAQSAGRIQAILNTAAPLVMVIPKNSSCRELSAALRIAHALNVYHKLDAEVIECSEALSRGVGGSLGSGNIIVIGDAAMPFVQWVLTQKKTPFQIRGTSLNLNGRLLVEPGLGILFTHPHPSEVTAEMLFILATDVSGLEKAIRLFPIRTGITVPDWLIIGDWAHDVGAAAVIGAGVWGRSWSWNPYMSWLY